MHQPQNNNLNTNFLIKDLYFTQKVPFIKRIFQGICLVSLTYVLGLIFERLFGPDSLQLYINFCGLLFTINLLDDLIFDKGKIINKIPFNTNNPINYEQKDKL